MQITNMKINTLLAVYNEKNLCYLTSNQQAKPVCSVETLSNNIYVIQAFNIINSFLLLHLHFSLFLHTNISILCF